MNTTLLDKDVKRYVDAVAAALIDLPEATLAEILEDLAAHLSEFDLADGPLDRQLGDPAAYAQELRASAGFAPPPPPPSGGTSQLGAQVQRAFETVRTHRWWRSTRAFLPSLEPAWWVARAWLVVVVMAGANPSDIPIPAPNGNWFVGLVLLAALIPFSVRLGQGARRGHARHLNRAASVLGVVLLLVFFGGVREQQYSGSTVVYTPPRLVREMPVMLFDINGERDTGTQVIVTVDERGYLTDSDATVMFNGLATPVGPCPNLRPYAACLRADTAVVPSTSTAATVTTTVVPSTTVAAAVPSTTTPAAPTTTVPAAPTTTVAAPPAPTSGG